VLVNVSGNSFSCIKYKFGNSFGCDTYDAWLAGSQRRTDDHVLDNRFALPCQMLIQTSHITIYNGTLGTMQGNVPIILL
jgi:hypothetical protein